MNDILEGHVKLTFSQADSFCFCSKRRRFKIWVINFFLRKKKICCDSPSGLKSYYDGADFPLGKDGDNFEPLKVKFFEVVVKGDNEKMVEEENDIKNHPSIKYDYIMKYKDWILQKYYDRIGRELKRREDPNWRRVR